MTCIDSSRIRRRIRSATNGHISKRVIYSRRVNGKDVNRVGAWPGGMATKRAPAGFRPVSHQRFATSKQHGFCDVSLASENGECADLSAPMSLLDGICHGRHERQFCLAGIQAGMLDDDRDIGFEDTGIVGVFRDGFRILQIVEAYMPGAPRRYRDFIRSRRIAVLEVNRDGNVGIPVRGI